MFLINKLCEKAMEELEEAECYAELALDLKSTKPDIAAKLSRLSEEEVAQADNLMSMVATLCDEKKREGAMHEHDAVKCEVKQEFYHEEKADVKLLQAAYKM